jgi:protein TonB
MTSRGRSRARRRLRRIVAGVSLLTVVAAVGLALYIRMTEPGPVHERVVHQITLVRPPPPPPPPPMERPPPPPEQPIETPKPEPEPTPTPTPDEAPPASPDLGIDAAGAGAGDAFGLVGRPGGRDLLDAPTIGGGGGNPYARFGALLQERVREAVLAHEQLRAAPDYQRVVLVWLGNNGQVSRFELVGAAQRPELDAALQQALGNVAALREPVPASMPQPVRLRITTRS